MQKKITLLLASIILTFLISGCTIAGKPDGGIYKSTDSGKVFEQKDKISDKANIANTNVLSFEFDPTNPDTIYIGTAADGILRSTDGAETWIKDINNYTSVTGIQIDPGNNQTIYVSAVKDGRGKVFKTTNGGEQWDEIFTENNSGPMILSLELDSSNTSNLYAGDSQGAIYQSTDAGQSWKTILWAKSPVKSISFDSVNKQIIYFGTSSTGALITRDGGQNFDEIVDSGNIYNLQSHPYKANAVYLSDKNGLQVSEDNGTTWKQINTLIQPEDLGSRGLAINPQNDNEILFASAKAFYKTTNAGETWSPVQFNISRSIDIIKINPQNTNIIYLGTEKRSSGTSLFPF